jgi:hypothetical protein
VFLLSIGEKISTSTIGTLCNDIASILYNSGKDLESTNSKMVMGFLMSDDDDLCVISEKASFPVRKGKENKIGLRHCLQEAMMK